MTRSGLQSDFLCREHSGLVDRRAVGSVVAQEDKDTKFPSAEDLKTQILSTGRSGRL